MVEEKLMSHNSVKELFVGTENTDRNKAVGEPANDVWTKVCVCGSN